VNTDLIHYAPVETIVAAYRDALGEIRRAHELLASAQSLLGKAFADSYRFTVAPRESYGQIGDAAVKNIERTLHRAALAAIIDKLKIRPALSEKRWRELERQLEESPLEELPAIDVDAIRAMVDGMAENLGTYLVEAVTEVYNTLRPRAESLKKLKTNSQFGVGKKAIVWRVSWEPYGRGRWDVPYSYIPTIMAIDNVFHVLDGKRRPEGSYYGPLVDAIKTSEDGTGETEYFRFRCHKNGHLHLTFKRPDLVHELNVVAGSGKLRQRAA
jgi:hypothetical protein